MKTWLLYLVVSVSGAVILAVEILGTRILGPFYGVSLYLWSALISVTLLSLSLGYWIGGRWADRSPRPELLSFFMSLAGLWIILTPLLKLPLLHLADFLGLRGAVLLSALFLFAPPLTFLGMISPFAVKLHAGKLERIGQTVGTLYAVSTLASVLAAILTGFVLIPYIGVIKLTLLLGALLLLTALLIAWMSRSAKSFLPSMIFLVSGTIAAVCIFEHQSHQTQHYVANANSPYADVSVVDEDGTRSLIIDGAVHTMIDSITGANLLSYGVVMELLNDLTGLEKGMLMIGLGGGALYNKFVDDGWKVDAVEIDPVVIQFAKSYFNPPRTDHFYCMDGRQFLMRNDKKYNVILVDAFGSSAVPFHLVTREAFGVLKSRLQQNGLLAINLISQGWDSPFLNSVAATVKEHFAFVLTLPCDEPPNILGNLVLLASDKEITMPEEWLPRPYDFLYDGYLHWAVVQKNHAWNNRYIPSAEKAQIITDDLNPVDLWSEEINVASRRAYWEAQKDRFFH
jgi:spermidine synthase